MFTQVSFSGEVPLLDGGGEAASSFSSQVRDRAALSSHASCRCPTTNNETKSVVIGPLHTTGSNQCSLAFAWTPYLTCRHTFLPSSQSRLKRRTLSGGGDGGSGSFLGNIGKLVDSNSGRLSRQV